MRILQTCVKINSLEIHIKCHHITQFFAGAAVAFTEGNEEEIMSFSFQKNTLYDFGVNM